MSEFTFFTIILLILYAVMCGLGRLVKAEENGSGFKLFTVAFYSILWLWVFGVICLGGLLTVLNLFQDQLPHRSPEDLAKLKAGFKLLTPFSIACVSVGLTSVCLMFKQARLWLSRWLPFRMESPLHHFGLMLLLPAVALFISSFIMLSPQDLIKKMAELDMLAASAINTSIFIGLALVGIGWGYFRNTQQSKERLGLGNISGNQALLGIGIAVGMFVFFSFILDPILRYFLPTDTAFQETIMQLTKPGKSTGNVPLEIIGISLMAGVGEELFFRGLLLPIVGLVPSALLFALIHLQYGISSGFIIVFCCGLLLGWVRQRYNTTLGILIHTLYDILALTAVSYFIKPH